MRMGSVCSKNDNSNQPYTDKRIAVKDAKSNFPELCALQKNTSNQPSGLGFLDFYDTALVVLVIGHRRRPVAVLLRVLVQRLVQQRLGAEDVPPALEQL